ncbi:MAG: hypothetical protein IJI37_01215, partial [Opitutales bacterium]|nr:hypothetical protein [Opitutales bacterium]
AALAVAAAAALFFPSVQTRLINSISPEFRVGRAAITPSSAAFENVSCGEFARAEKIELS